MSKHKGWTVRQQGNALVARAWDPRSKRYRSKSFALNQARSASEWAKDQHANYRLKREKLGQAPTGKLKDDYLADTKRKGVEPRYLEDLEKMLTGYAAAVPDLASDAAKNLALTWWDDVALTVPRKGSTAPPRLRSPKTRNNYLFAAKAFNKWTVKHGHIDRDPLLLVDPVKNPTKTKPQFTIAELRKMVKASKDPYHLRAMVMLYAGLRASEALHLRRTDWDKEGKILSISHEHAKGSKARFVPVQPRLARWLGRKGTWQDDGFLFPKKIRDQDRHKQGRELQSFCRRLEIPVEGRSPHSYRHCFAGLMTATGVPSLILQEWMGHVSLQTTAGYARLSARYLEPCKSWQRGTFRL